ncbi:MAG: ATP-binding cassette domain-containing protein, partial [Lentisphaeria bacterium]
GMGALAVLVLCGVATGSIILRLSFVALAMMRLMPSLSRLNYYLSTMRHSLPAFTTIMDDLAALQPPPPPTAPPLPFRQSIRLEQVSFKFEGRDSCVVAHFDLEIPRNRSLALVGKTGCGKTTVLDLILGLLKPTAGRVLVDGRDIEENLPSWQRRIGYVPQVIHLMDDSLRANVAFGVPVAAIDDAKVQRCLEAAQLWSFVGTLPAGLETVVGERGVRLSGGQRQRIGIARALYHDPEVLALDEATSALDHETEQAIVTALQGLHGRLTIIMIAHRLTTVQGCDQIVNLETVASARQEAS